MSARAKWNALTEQSQYGLIVGCICRTAKLHGVSAGDPLSHVGDTWLRVMDKLDEDKDLRLIVMDSAWAALQKAYRQDKRYADAANFEVKDADGVADCSVLDLVAGGGSVENEAVVRVDFGVFYDALDAINKQIVDGLAVGLTYREIAPTVNLTHGAVGARIGRMRETLTACMA